jgi:hypothetical protein
MSNISAMVSFGELKKLTPREKTEKIVKNSELEIKLLDPGIQIRITGEAARIPSMKNSKLPGKNFANPDFKARVKAMDILFRAAVLSAKIDPWALYYGGRVSVSVFNSKRSARFDPIGALETVQDWFEPASKPVGAAKKPRGWGIGLIADDNQISLGISVRVEEFVEVKDKIARTVILMKPFSTGDLIFNHLKEVYESNLQV